MSGKSGHDFEVSHLYAKLRTTLTCRTMVSVCGFWFNTVQVLFLIDTIDTEMGKALITALFKLPAMPEQTVELQDLYWHLISLRQSEMME